MLLAVKYNPVKTSKKYAFGNRRTKLVQKSVHLRSQTTPSLPVDDFLTKNKVETLIFSEHAINLIEKCQTVSENAKEFQ